MVDGIERLSEIDGEGGSTVGGLSLIKAGGDKGGEGQEGGGGRVPGAETVLGVVRGQGKVEVGEDEALEHLGGWTEQGDRAVATAEVGRLTGFGDGEDYGLFPYIRNLRACNREVEYLS